MTSLVSEFLINPVLRQARRFSRSDAVHTHDSNDSLTPQSVLESSNEVDEVVVEDVTEEGRVMGLPDVREHAGVDDRIGSPSNQSPTHQGNSPANIHSLRHEVDRNETDPLITSHVQSNMSQIDSGVTGSPPASVASQTQGNVRDGRSSSAALNVLDLHMSSAEGLSQHLSQDSTSASIGLDTGNCTLPADDGMGPLRQRIKFIQAMDIPTEQKALLMHQLLTESYNQAHEIFNTKNCVPSTTAEKMISQERPATPGSLSSFIWQMNGALDPVPATEIHTFHLSPDDLERTYAPLDPAEVDDGSEETENTEDSIPMLGCKHYKRNVKLQCSTCDRWYTCRLCHDEVEDHILIRHETKNMLCMVCGCAQRAGEFCVECGERAAWYYCGVCKLWDNDPNKSIYHCNDCGICRKGRGLGKDFFHCKTCGVCMSMSLMDDHKCIERVSDCDCPICGDYMFTSPKPVVFMICGHSIHSACYIEHMQTSYKCPICSRSVVGMETQFRNLDRAIDNQPMPPQFRNTLAMVSCNDCYAKSAVKYHWLGLKCAICDSYNTAQLSILSDPEVEAPATGVGDAQTDAQTAQEPRETFASTHLIPGVPRNRRHSSHIPSSSSQGESGRFTPYSIPSRLGRSVSPARGLGLFSSQSAAGGQSDDSGDEDDLDFWGRDEPRSSSRLRATLDAGVDAQDDNDIEYEDDSSDSESGNDDDDDDGEEEPFAIFGHR
ncbi:fffd5dda-8b8c-402e-821b-32cdd2d46b55 [Sclerotinia trifoliorum]|uniref:Fffd5dda-8b8c-402e-821b-32cdd2d46b55 n=1 Tax=Sclerotinia trifoliorum TaxID=28548 RepID=A0A8H2VYM1_9HELO|nr:fffd5dda-8b8c-402e-821b-32cdd2d46b55 [Sclerotinia trifoliorum]